MRNVLVIAPHADDETLGCGGTLLRHSAEGDSTSWLIMTDGQESLGYSNEFIKRREKEIKNVANDIRLKLNPHPAGQMELNVPQLKDGTKLYGM